jgi:hypothetical protein
MAKKRPFGVTILALLAVVGAVVAVYYTLQLLGIFPFTITGPFGNAEFQFYGVNWLGAIMWGLMVLIWIWVARMLWNLDPQGWVFIAALSALNLVLAVLSIFGDSTWQSQLPALVVNGLILIYALLPGTKDAFNVAST